jgi:hypothetical protein
MFLDTQQRWIEKISSRRAMKRQASTVIRAKPRRNWERYSSTSRSIALWHKLSPHAEDDMTDSAVSAILDHLDTRVVLARAQASRGIYPAVDPLQSGSQMMDRHVVGDHHYQIAEGVREHLSRYHELEDLIAMIGIEELSEQDQRTVRRARKLQRYLSQPFHVISAHSGIKGVWVPLAGTLDDCEAFLLGQYEDVAEDPVLHARVDEGAGDVNTFVMHLQDATSYERIKHVESFVGADDSGSFGVQAGHARLMTSLVFGLARYRVAGEPWQYIAALGAALHAGRRAVRERAPLFSRPRLPPHERRPHRPAARRRRRAEAGTREPASDGGGDVQAPVGAQP